MKKIIYTLILSCLGTFQILAQCGGSGQPPCNPGFFEIQGVAEGLGQYIIQMRAINSVVPQQSFCSGFPASIQDNVISDITFGVTWPDGAPILGLIPQTVTPCSCSGGLCQGGGGGYSIDFGTDPTLSTDGTYWVQGFAAVSTPYGTPDDWVLDEWMTICTLDICFGDECLGTPEMIDLHVYALGDDEDLEVTNSVAPNFNFAIDPPGQGAMDYTPAVEGVLPLDLLSFTAQKSGERSAQLVWSTANEVNTSYFIVERSTDLTSWQVAGKVQAAGESISILNYQFLDENVYDGRRVNARYYYRLNIVDRDTRSRKSNIELVNFGTNLSVATVYVFPNPSTNGVNVELNYTQDTTQPAEIMMYNDLGQLVYQQIVPESSTLEFIDFSKTNINSGTYSLQVMDQTNGILATEKIVVQR